jgi:hypothetical protein
MLIGIGFMGAGGCYGSRPSGLPSVPNVTGCVVAVLACAIARCSGWVGARIPWSMRVMVSLAPVLPTASIVENWVSAEVVA